MLLELYIGVAIILDWFIGDPRWFPHPVRIIGKCCHVFEHFFRSHVHSAKIAGIMTVTAVLISSTLPVLIILTLLRGISLYLQGAAVVLIFYVFIAVRDLLKHSEDVYEKLCMHNNIGAARLAVSRIVGRDTDSLKEEGIIRACVETVAENCVDGITAPLFWLLFFTLVSPLTSVDPLTMAALGITTYKTANTMDSMFGYRNERYRDFGWAAAKLDDLLNFIPARLTGICVVVASFFLTFDWKTSARILIRDRCNHTSPNAAHTEAAVAGALGIQLGGDLYYFGEKTKKPFIGDRTKTIKPHHIVDTNKIIIYSSIIFLVLLLFLRKIVF